MSRRSWAIVVTLAVVLAGAVTYSVWPESGPSTTSPGDPTNADRLKNIDEQLEALGHDDVSPDAGFAPLAGVVADEDGAPIAGAAVWLSIGDHDPLDTLKCEICSQQLLTCEDPQSGREVLALARAGKLASRHYAETRTDALGHFKFAAAPLGHLVVHAATPGLGEARVEVELGPEDVTPPGDADDDSNGADLIVTLMKLQRTEGHVKDDKNAPVRGAHLSFVDTVSGSVIETDADDRGVFSIQSYASQGLWLFAEAPGYRASVTPEIYADGEAGISVRISKPRLLRVETRLAGKPVDAAVELTGAEHVRHVTAVAGTAMFEDLPIETFGVTASFQTFVSPKTNTDLEGLEKTIRVDLKPAARLSVEVLDEQGQSVVSAHVTVEGSGDSVSQDADEKGGLIVFERLAEGMYEIRIDASGLHDVTRRMDVHAGDNHLSVTLQKATELKGKVVDAEGVGVKNATVELVSQIHQAQATTTDDEGAFTLPVDEPGSYRVRAREAQHGVTIAQVTAPAEGLTLKLEPLGRISVRVVADHNPLSGAYVSVFSTPAISDDSATATSDDTGLARFAGLHGGQYSISVEQQGYQHEPPITAEVALGGNVELTVELQKGALVTGRVVDAAGAPVSGAEVRAEADLGGATLDERKAKGLAAIELTNGVAYTGEDGEFSIEGLRSAQVYNLTASAEDRSLKTPLKVKPPQSGLVVKLDPLPTVVGRVLDETGSPLHNFRVDGREVESTDGHFSVGHEPDPAGKLSLTIDADGYQALMLDRDATADVGDVQLKKAPSVRGMVVDATAQPVSGAEVSCDSCSDTATTDHDGTFTLTASGDATDVVVTASKLDDRGHGKGTTDRPITVTMQSPVRVEGIVKDPTGKPLQARVTVREINGGDEKRVDSGPDGKFEIDLPEAVWMFITRASSTGQTVKVVAPKMFVTLGAPPGTCAVTITVGESVGDAWLVPGEPEKVPLEALDDDGLYAGAVAVDLPLPNRPTRSAGLTCGVYTLVTTDSSGVRRERVDVRSTESTYTLAAGTVQTSQADQQPDQALPQAQQASPQQPAVDPTGEP